MQTNTTAAATTKPKQYTFGVSENLKSTLTEFRGGFTRAAAVKTAPAVAMSEKECLEVLYKVASDRRFKSVPVMETLEIDGESVQVESFDGDGMPVMETIDLFQVEWDSIVARDYAVAEKNTVDGLTKSLVNLMRKQGKSEASIAALLASLA